MQTRRACVQRARATGSKRVVSPRVRFQLNPLGPRRKRGCRLAFVNTGVRVHYGGGGVLCGFLALTNGKQNAGTDGRGAGDVTQMLTGSKTR